MKSFLQQVAQHYAVLRGLEDFCFVFPNRRSGKFFEQCLGEAINGPAMMPRIVTMADFLGDITGHIQVSNLEALLVLYKSYCQVMGNEAASFDTFVFWGNLIINDFNDADMNLVDVRQLYANVSDLRKISTDYLDDDLRQDIERVLNVRVPRGDGEHLWREPWHSRDDDNEVRKAYFSLWEKLYDIYCAYHELLAQQGLNTIGRIYRDAAGSVRQASEHQLPHWVVMVGFSSLSVSELAIFKTLKQRGNVHFWWDNALEELAQFRDNPAGDKVREYARMFPMPIPLQPVSLCGKQIEAVAIPSNVGQAKWAFHRIDQMIEQGHIPHPDNAIDTAIVLPDEALFVPLVNSVCPSITQLNVTMGYPLRQSNIVSLMHLVARAHKQASHIGGQWTYYREDIKDIMSHPVIKTVYTRQAMQVTNRITELNEWNVPANWLCQVGFSTLFTPLQHVDDKEQVLAYLDRLIGFCLQVNERIKITDTGSPEAADEDEHDDDAHIKKSLPLQSAFIDQYVDALEQLKLAFAVHGAPIVDDTLFYLIDRLVQTTVIPFEGEPLKGLQIMGLQETRSLDFDNLIILSMNERVFPRKHGIASLIPDNLRSAFFMLTGSQQEDIAAYDFYRLISRASRVVLTYSTTTQGATSSEPSRFIAQLRLLYGDRVEFVDYKVDTRVTSPAEIAISVPKAQSPMHDYSHPSVEQDPENAKCLSHSSIAEYMDCPLKFYLHHVEHLSDNTDSGDFMDKGTFGNIIHDSLQTLYYPPMPDKSARDKPHLVTAEMIAQFKKAHLRQVVEREINKQYLHHAPDAPIEGEALILQETIETFVMRALDHDLRLLAEADVNHLEVIECERPHWVQLDFGHDNVEAKFNFTYKPDRVDRIAGKLRMVDYKTGGDPTTFAKLDDLFEAPSSSKKRCKAILQLMLYSNAWHLEHPSDRIIEPVIYKLSDMEQTGVWFGKDRFIFDAGGDFNHSFRNRMGDVISTLLDRTGLFTQAETGSHYCSFCRFSDFCRR